MCHWENPGDRKPQGGKKKESQESAALNEATRRSRLSGSVDRLGGKLRLTASSLLSSNPHCPFLGYPPDTTTPHGRGNGHPPWAATHVLQRTVLTGIPLLRVKTQDDSLAQEQRSPDHDVPDWPFPAVVNDEVKSHLSQKENKNTVIQLQPARAGAQTQVGADPSSGLSCASFILLSYSQINDA